MINIVCLKWGTKYGPEYVNKLYGSVCRHTTVEFKFHCFTEDPTGLNSHIIIHPLPYSNLEGWWNKLYLFSDDINIPKNEKIFFIDLDTLITGNIDDILRHDCEFITVLRDFYTGIATSVVGLDNVGSGLMSWYNGQYNFIWKTFIQNPDQAMKLIYPHGDQKWIQRECGSRVYWQDLFPNQIVSFKVHCNSGLAPDARIVCYHGKPSIPESFSQHTKSWKFNISPQLWVLDHWKE